MANNNLEVGITIRANGGRAASAEINQVRGSVSVAGNAAQTANRQFADMAKTLITGLGFAAFAKDVLNVNREMESLRASLKSVTGSEQGAIQAFNFIQNFAKTTPYEIKGLTQTYVMLQNMGIKPTQQVMEALTNQASKLGGSQETLTAIALQLGQAHSKGRLQMEDMVILMERGVPVMELLSQVTGKNTEKLAEMSQKGQLTTDIIDKLIVKMGELSSGANANAMETLNGKISSLSDAWHSFEDALLQDKSEGIIKNIVDGWTQIIDGFTAQLNKPLMERINTQLVDAKDTIASMDKSNIPGHQETPAYQTAQNDIKTLLGLREKLIASDLEEIKSTKAMATEESKLLELNKKRMGSTKDAAITHHAAAKVKTAAMSEEEKSARSLQQAYDSLEASLKKQLALSQNEGKNASLEYDLSNGSLKDLIESKKLYLLQLAQEAQNNEVTKQEAETKKSEMDSLIDKYNQLTLSAREYYKTKLEGEGIKGAAQEPLLAQFDKNTAAEAQKKAADDAKVSIDALLESTKTTNASMKDLAASATNVFDASLGGANQLVGVFDNMLDGIKNNKIALIDLLDTKNKIDAKLLTVTHGSDEANKLFEARKNNEASFQLLQQKTFNDYLTGTRQMAGATASMLAENKDAQLAAQAVSLVTLGIQAVQAIVTQGQGDPYTAFARIAAMAAIVGQMVSSVGGTSPGSYSASMPKTTASTSTVLGDKKIESNSVNNVYDLLKTIHAEEYAELRGINRGVSGLADAITGTVTKLFQAGGLTQAAIDTSTQMSGIGGAIQMGSGIGKFDPISNFILKGLFGTTTKSVVGGGIFTNAVRPGEDVSGGQYSTIATTKKSWFSTKTKYSQALSALDQGTEDALTSVFKNMGDVMSSVAGNLGKTVGKDIGARVKNYIIPAMQIELHGLTGEEAAKKLNGIISATLDTMASSVFGDIVGQYQKLGEGMLETAVRIVSEVAVVKDALAQSGMAMATNAVDLADSLVQAAGGLEQFQQQFNDFYDKFFSDTEKQNRLQTRLNETFAEVYMLLPRTREEYKKILSALDLNNKADQERYSLMLQLSSAADTYYKGLENKSADASKLRDDTLNQEIELLKLTGNAAGALALERKRELAAMDASLRAMQSLIYTLTDFSSKVQETYNTAADLLTSTFTKFFTLAKSLVQYRDALKVGDLSTGSPESKYKANKSEFEKVKAIIAGGKGTTGLSEQRYMNALESLQGVSDKFLSSSRDYNASGKGYTTDYKSVIATLTSGANKSLNIASNAEKQLNALNDMVSGLTTLNLSIIKLDGSIGKVDGSVDNVGARVRVSNEQLRGVNSGIKTGNTWLGKVDTKTDKVSGQLTSSNVWIREGNKWLRLVDGSTGRVNAQLKDSNLWIKEGNHYLSLVDKNTGKVNDKLINVDGSVKKVYQSTDKAPSATDLVRQAINGGGGLKDATKAVKDQVKALNSKAGLAGAIGGVKDAIGSVHSAVKGTTAAIVAINKLQKDRNIAERAAMAAEREAERKRKDAERALAEKQKHDTYNAIVGKTNYSAINSLALGSGLDATSSAQFASALGPLVNNLVGAFDSSKSISQYTQLSTLMDTFKKYLVALATGKSFPYDTAYFYRRVGEINGSHANGLNFVPFDGYRAELHRGERVLTASEARNADSKATEETIKICNEILAELKAANKQRGAVAVETIKKVDKLIDKTEAQTRATKRITV